MTKARFTKPRPRPAASSKTATEAPAVARAPAPEEAPKKLAEAVDLSLSSERFTLPAQNNEAFRFLGNQAEVAESRQNSSFSIPVVRQYERGQFPEGLELLEHPGANGAERMTSEECRAVEREKWMDYDKLRQAAQAHKQTRRFMHGVIKPGMTTLEIAQILEAKSKELIVGQSSAAGWAFPTGLSINDCAAHYSPNYGEEPVVLGFDDVMKVDFGVHVEGLLIDSAWTVSFNEKFDPLVEATKEATNAGLRAAGIDVRLGELGGVIEEVIRSYEVEITPGKPPVPIKPIQNLSGHSIEPYKIHAGKSVPLVACEDRSRMEEGELYAIETFASTGHGKVDERGACSHYMIDHDWATNKKRGVLRQQSAAPLLKHILKTHETLAFCRRWLDDAGFKRHLLSLKALEQAGIINTYPPLYDSPGSYTSQMEHTFLLRPTCKEILSRGDDY